MARDLYDSPLFQGRRCWVEGHCDRWYVISALHGLVRPNTVLAPYEYTLKGKPVAMKKAWSERVLAEITDELGPVHSLRFSVHAGADYSNFGLVDGLMRLGATAENPVKGLGMGKQLQFYQRECQP